MKDFEETRNKFITQWGVLGSLWGINRTMAQIHACLMISTDPLSTQQIMDELAISRGNANTNLRDLVSWGLIRRITYKGDRKEYFEAEKDVWKMFCTIASERRRREITPALELLQQCKSGQGKAKTDEEKAFLDQVTNLEAFVSVADSMMEKVSKSERNKLMPKLLKLL
ncbi:MAG: GbsR/MarR family transcriptional regulator [Opitutales bacterium]